MPLVVQYNKRDLPTALPLSELQEALAVPEGVPEVQASAVTGDGVFETFKSIVKSCMSLVGDPTREARGAHGFDAAGAASLEHVPGGCHGRCRQRSRA